MVPKRTRSSLEAFLLRAKHHPVIVVMTVLLAEVVGGATLLNSFDSIGNFFHEHVETRGKLPANSDVPVRVLTKVLPASASPSISGSSHLPTISAEAVFDALQNRSFTDLQRSQFMRRTSGLAVQWDGFVRSVDRESEGDPNSAILVVFVPSFASEEQFPPLVVASFPSSSEADLSALSNGDKITVMGHLDYLDSLPPAPSLRKCQLITYVRSARGK